MKSTSDFSKDEEAMPYALRNSAFAGALLDPDTDIPHGIGKKPEKTNGIAIGSSPKRFSVYRNNVVVSLMEAMRAAFPSIATIMGEENFNRVARNFILSHPPSSPMMQNYGEEFPSFLENFKPLAKSPFLKDVAEAELAWLKAFHARDEQVLTPQELQSVPEATLMDLVLTPHSALHILRSEFPVFDLFNARDEWPKAGLNIEQPQSMLITRPVYDCFASQIDEAMAVFFSHLCDGTPLGQAIALVTETHENFDPTAAISALLQTGAFKTLESSFTN